jgi:hypothetical protein
MGVPLRVAKLKETAMIRLTVSVTESLMER